MDFFWSSERTSYAFEISLNFSSAPGSLFTSGWNLRASWWSGALHLLRVGGAGDAEHVVIIATRANRESSAREGRRGASRAPPNARTRRGRQNCGEEGRCRVRVLSDERGRTRDAGRGVEAGGSKTPILRIAFRGSVASRVRPAAAARACRARRSGARTRETARPRRRGWRPCA